MRNRLALVFLLSFALPWAAPAQAAPRGTVTIAINGEPETMDPHVYSSFIGAMVWPWASDLLIIQDAKEGKVVPWLAEKYERLDSRRMKFTLRNAKFTDGTPVTSEAVKYSMGRIVDPENKSYQRAYWKDF